MPMYFNWNTSVTGHKQGRVIVPSADNFQGQFKTHQSVSVEALFPPECVQLLKPPQFIPRCNCRVIVIMHSSFT
jgi:hypothetical protein